MITRHYGNGVNRFFPIPVTPSMDATATVGGAAATIVSQVPSGVLFQTAPAAGALIEITHTHVAPDISYGDLGYAPPDVDISDSLWEQVVLLVQGEDTPMDISSYERTPAFNVNLSHSALGSEATDRTPATQLQFNSIALFNSTNPTFTLEFFCTPTDENSSFFMAQSAARYFTRQSSEINCIGYGVSPSVIASPLNNEIHIAIVRDAVLNQSRVYLNGTRLYEETAGPWTTALPNLDLFAVPGRPDLAPFVGRIRQVRLTSGVRYTGSSFSVPTDLFPVG